VLTAVVVVVVMVVVLVVVVVVLVVVVVTAAAVGAAVVMVVVVAVVLVVVVMYENVMIRLVFRCVAPRHSASSGCGWRRFPADMESSCLYIYLTSGSPTVDGPSARRVGEGAKS
jgi:hypothetical protein